jgi:hypothetical protein
MKAKTTVLGTFFLLLAATAASAAPTCMGSTEISGLRVLRAESNGTLVLDKGQVLKLESIRLTAAGSDMVQRLMVGETPRFFVPPPRQDRYGRTRVQAVLGNGVWLQQHLLERGLARVELAPDRAECAAELYAAEKRARDAHAGLWSQPGNSIRTAVLRRADTGTFQLVEGRVLNVDIRNSRAYLNFGTDYKTDFTVTISPEDRKAYWGSKANPRDYLGKTIRVRGIVQYYNGPELEVAAPHQIEIAQ